MATDNDNKMDDKDAGSWNKLIKLFQNIEKISSRLSKTELCREFVDNYSGDLKVYLSLILPKITHRTYQMNRKRILKLFGSIFNEDVEILNDMMTTGSFAGYLGKTISHCYLKSTENFPLKKSKSIISMYDINEYLNALTKETREPDQEKILKKVVMSCNPLDLKWFIRELDKDLKINAGTKSVFDGIDKKAYETWQTSANLDYIVNKLSLIRNKQLTSLGTVGTDLMIPLKPMLASPCKTYKFPFEKWGKNSLVYAEIKYDGERVQVHFDGKEWKFYSRSLKPVQEYKIKDVKDYISKALPLAKTLILDCEILMINTITNKPAPFGSLGKNKRKEYGKDIQSCLFIFDILYLNGESLINKSLENRRNLLQSNFKQIKHKIHLSELMILKTEKEIKSLMIKMIDDNQEGLVLKDSKGKYSPNKRHWLKMKKDYLSIDSIDGKPNTSMADSADLIIMGAYKGHGKNGGLYSTFLMGTLDKTSNIFMTVCKAHNGLSDDQIKYFTDTLSDKMIPFDSDNCPQWLSVTKTLEPDWIVKNPKKSPIFEISGFEFSNSKVHTATDQNGQGFSIRFPRITRIRDDKKYKDATSLTELRALIKVSRNINPLKRAHHDDDDDDDDNDDLEPPTKKRKITQNQDEDIDIKDNEDDDENTVNNKIKNMKIKIDTNKNENDGVSPPPSYTLPASPKIKNDTRVICQYDMTCYRKNPDHFREYQHPKKEEKEIKEIHERTKTKMSEVIERKENLMRAAKINREKRLKTAKEKYDKELKEIEEQYEKIVDKAETEYDEKSVPIKQNEQFELEKLEKKYHP